MKTTPTRKKFGKHLRQLRQAKSYSQESLALQVGLHRTYIGSIERGEQSVSLDNLARLATALDIKIAELVKNL